MTRRRNSWLQKKVPSRTMLVTERNALGRMEAARTGKLAAALLTRTAGVPSAASIVSNASEICSGSRMSAAACAARPPTASTAATPDSRCSSDREMTPMAAPARASSTAMARPRPVPPPVTIAVVPSKVPAGRKGDPAGGGSGSPIYLPSNSACCFLALAAYPAGMSSLTNSTDALEGLELERLGQAAPGEGVDGALDRLHGQRGVGRDLGRDRHGGGDELVACGDLLHDAEAFGRRRVDAPAGEREQLGVAGTHLVGQPQVATRIDGHAHLRLGEGEQGVVGRHPDVAHERELEAEAEAVPLDRADDRLRQLVEDAEALVHPADALVVVAHLLGGRAPGHPVLGHAEVHAGAEGAALGLDHEDADAVVEAGTVGEDAQLARRLPRPHVQLLGVVEREGADARAVLGGIEAELPVVLGQHRLGADRHGGLLPPLLDRCRCGAPIESDLQGAPD